MNKLQSSVFFDWFVRLDIEMKIFAPGNHSTAITRRQSLDGNHSTAIADGLITPAHFPSVRFLIHESMELSGLQIFGLTPEPFWNSAFMKKSFANESECHIRRGYAGASFKLDGSHWNPSEAGQISSSHYVGIVLDRSVDRTPEIRWIAEQSTTLQIAQF